MKKIVTLLAVGIVAACVSPVFADSSNTTAIINVADILQNSSRVQAINDSIRSKFQPQQVKLAAEDKEIKDEQAKLIRDGAVMTATQKTDLQNTIAENKKDFVKNASLFQQNLSAARDDAMKEVINALNADIAKVAQAKGFGLVLFSQAVAYPGNAQDITQAVADDFNSAK